MLYCCNRNSLSRDVADATSLIRSQIVLFAVRKASFCCCKCNTLFRKLLRVPRLKRSHAVAFATVKFNMLHTQHIGLRRIVAVATTEVFRGSVANAIVLSLLVYCCICNSLFLMYCCIRNSTAFYRCKRNNSSVLFRPHCCFCNSVGGVLLTMQHIGGMLLHLQQ